MAEQQSWPAWRYGPNGEAQIFVSDTDVPEGWAAHPSKLPPAEGKLPEREDAALNNSLREEMYALRAECASLREANEDLSEENERLRAANEHLQEEFAKVRATSQRNVGGAAQTEPPSARRGPRKLSARSEPEGAKGTPFMPQDETVTVDEGRTERLKVLRAAGITIADDATDGDIEEAMDWLVQQSEKN